MSSDARHPAAFGKYEVLDKIGEGGFGTVYRGRDSVLKRKVAIKICSSASAELRHRFFREAEIAAGLQHPNITTVYDLGFHDEMPYLVQEYLGGEDLDHKIVRRDPLSLRRKLGWLIQVARGLEHAHTNGVVHRDIKPSNVRVLDNDDVKIMDFGIAKLLTAGLALTQTGTMIGTAAYLPPEQLRGDAVDGRSDVFSFGAMAYELLSYRRSFEGESYPTIFNRILHEEPPPLSEVAPDCPPRVVKLVERCLRKRPADRFQSCRELRLELERAMAELPADVTEAATNVMPAPAVHGAAMGPVVVPVAAVAQERVAVAPLDPPRPPPAQPVAPGARPRVAAGDEVVALPARWTRSNTSHAFRTALSSPRSWGAFVAASIVVLFAGVGAYSWVNARLGSATDGEDQPLGPTSQPSGPRPTPTSGQLVAALPSPLAASSPSAGPTLAPSASSAPPPPVVAPTRGNPPPPMATAAATRTPPEPMPTRSQSGPPPTPLDKPPTPSASPTAGGPGPAIAPTPTAAPATDPNARPRIAVLPLGLSKETSVRYPHLADRSVGFGVHNRIQSTLEDAGRFVVVEVSREILDALVDRQWVGGNGAANQANAEAQGKGLDVDYVVYGEVYDFSSRTTGKRGETRIELQVKIVNVATHVLASGVGSGTVAEASEFVESNERDFARSTVGKATAQAIAEALTKMLRRFDADRI